MCVRVFLCHILQHNMMMWWLRWWVVIVVVVDVGWTNRKYVQLSFSSMNFRSNNWMIRDSETKCTKTNIINRQCVVHSHAMHTQCTVHAQKDWLHHACVSIRKSTASSENVQTNLNVFIVDYVFIFPLQLAAPYTTPQLLPHSFLLWRIDSIFNRLKCRTLKLLWWMQVISMTSFIIYIGFYQRWHSLASTLVYSCDVAWRVCVPLYYQHHPATLFKFIEFIFATRICTRTHIRLFHLCIIRSKLLSNSLSLPLWSAFTFSNCIVQSNVFRQKVTGRWRWREIEKERKRQISSQVLFQLQHK